LGDRANREVIEAIAAARSTEGQAGDLATSGPAAKETPLRTGVAYSGKGNAWPAGFALRHRIEHAQLLHPDDFARLTQAGITASMQPIHCTADMDMADLHWGEPRCKGAYGWRSVLDAGARLALGSDAPVESLDVLTGIHAAVTRRRADGSPGPEGWHPEQRLSVAEAVHGYTMGAALVAGEDRNRGSITPGKLADLVVLSQDIFECPAEEILDTRVDLTLSDGQVVYSR
jgi:predicted amidohydrolase YtcJ